GYVLPQYCGRLNTCGSELARDDGRSDTQPLKLKYFQVFAEVNPTAIRVVTETASHSHPLRFYTGHES
ncbi:hypothetical protein, partial [Pseudomonas sp. FW215-T2]|uniref:hypothetical protein n=1 Tax=Pseudomonas sp. FW215-T2 TaxID=2070672 RepID=UPI001C43937E